MTKHPVGKIYNNCPRGLSVSQSHGDKIKDPLNPPLSGITQHYGTEVFKGGGGRIIASPFSRL